MPFRSMSQRRKFYALKAQGKMDQAMIDKWEDHTPDKRLPERLHKKAEDTMQGFWAGFQKKAAQAAEKYVTADSPGEDYPGAPEKMLKWNDQGGVDPRAPEELQAAGASKLVTLPPDVDGAQCATCMHFRPITAELGHGFCTHPSIKQDVAEHMHCINWEHPGSHDPIEAAEEEAQQQQVEQAMMAQQGMPQQGMPQQGMPQQGMPQQGAPQDAFGQGAMLGGGAPQGTPQGTPESAPQKDMAYFMGQHQETPEDAEGMPSDSQYQPSAVGSTSGFPQGAQTSGNPLVEQAVDDFQGGAATAGPTGAEGQSAAKPKKESKPKPKGESKKESGGSGSSHTINIHVGGKGSEKKASISDCWKGIVEGY